MKKLILLSLVCFSSSAFAALPAGSFSGSANSSSFNEFCNVNQAEVQFLGSNDGSYQLTWEEHGMRNGNFGGGFCDNLFDASLSPTGANTWDVNFDFNSNLIFGKAVQTGNTIEITATYSGMNTGANSLRATFTVDEASGSLSYMRRIESNFGPSRIASGSLRR